MTDRRDVDEHLIPWSVYRQRMLQQRADNKNNKPMCNPALRDCLEHIYWIAGSILQETERSMKSGEVDEWAMREFKNAKYIADYRKWIKWILQVHKQDETPDNNQNEEVQ